MERKLALIWRIIPLIWRIIPLLWSIYSLFRRTGNFSLIISQATEFTYRFETVFAPEQPVFEKFQVFPCYVARTVSSGATGPRGKAAPKNWSLDSSLSRPRRKRGGKAIQESSRAAALTAESTYSFLGVA
jgi:hypothetical protein